ncbi:hypothetical protein, partial [Roseicyclus sp.]|uniref:hypothetical protein n=1 Tax=Roseicyclus sp. TaxID=1914329 RepID=UPI003FA025A9
MTSVLPIDGESAAHDAGSGGRPVLAIDLDGTLLRSDMLHETLWAALSVRSRLFWQSALALPKG